MFLLQNARIFPKFPLEGWERRCSFPALLPPALSSPSRAPGLAPPDLGGDPWGLLLSSSGEHCLKTSLKTKKKKTKKGEKMKRKVSKLPFPR